jgi:hypothetical protein
MNNVTAKWTLPTERENNKPLLPEEIKHSAVSFRVVGAPSWTHITNVLSADPQQVTITDMDGGDWEFQVIVTDINDLLSDPLQGTVTVPFSRPKAATNLILELS